jgi:hypothetical protein
MARTAIRCTAGVVRAIGVGVAILGLSLAWVQAPASAQEAPTFAMHDFGVVPRPALTQVLLQMPAVQRELKITEAQKKEQAEIEERRFQKIQQARTEIKDRAKFLAARTAIFNETAAAQLANLRPEQHERLAQIQLQAQGPLAFLLRERNESSPIGDPGRFIGPRLSEQLKMSDDQAKRVRSIAEEGTEQIETAAGFRLPWDAKDKPTVETIRKLVEGPEFRAAKEKARRTAHEAWDAVIGRIEAVLNDEQRANYRKVLGKPFDLTRLQFEQDQSETDADVQSVARALGLGGGQRADPGFDVKVARPTFTNLHPRVAIDEAHHNFHTAVGRYKPFADLMTNDGFLVSRNTEALNSQTLDRCDILVVANATAANAGGNDAAPASAFTEDECSAVQRWVWAGGALLLITDHEPYGSASVALAQRFGIVMNTSGTIDPANTDQKAGGLVFARESGLVVDHPITLGRDLSERINRVETFYGQAIYGPVGSTGFLRFADTASYESANGQQSAAGWAQGVALGYGAGRVVVMGEAAELSAQLAGLEPMGMNVPGIDNRQMALNIMHWLSRQLEPPTSTLTAAVTYTYWAPQRRRPFPRLFHIIPRRPSVPACVGSGW